MNSKFLLALLFALFAYLPNSQAQLENGSIAPNVTFTDINGTTHDLYTILEGGQSVIFDAFATWCGICWNYDNTGILKSIHNDYGPGGTNEVLVFALEASPSTTEPCLGGPGPGCSGGSIGDWITGTPYPIAHIDAGNAPMFNSDYDIPGYPTIYKICPNKKVYLVGQASTSTWVNWITSCSLEGEGTASDAICFNDGNAGVDLNVSGGFGTISYSWSNGATTQDLTNVAPGAYSVTITEGQGHAIEAGPFIVDGPSTALNLTLGNQGNVDCAGDGNGFIFMNTSGGAGGNTYEWSSGQMQEDITNLNGGIYTLSVTDNLGCEETFTTQVTEPSAISLSAQSTPENCDLQDGSIAVFASGGTSPFAFNLGTGSTTNNIFNNLAGGTYSLTVTDANGCSEVESVVVQEIAGPAVSIVPSTLIDCTVNQIQLSANVTGSLPYSILWSTTDGNIVSGATSLSPLIDQTGTYSIVVTNTDNGCTATSSVTIFGDTTPPVANAGPDGVLNCIMNTYTLNSAGSSSGVNYVYEWFDVNNSSLGSEATLEVSTSGEYELIVTNILNGCTSQSSATVTSDTNAPIALISGATELNCLTSSIILDGGGSSPNVSFAWTNAMGETIGTQSTVSVNSAGIYSLNVTGQSSGCTDQTQINITENIIEPTADAGVDVEINCATTSVTVGGNSSSGSTIDYSWTNSAGQEIGTTESLTVSTPGVLTLTVIDNENGCSSSSSVVVSQDTEVPVANAGNPITLNCDITEVTIGGNSTAGSNINYNWFNEAGTSIGQEMTITVDQPGTYTINVINTVNGCESTDDVTVSEDTNEPIANAGANGQLDCTTSSVILDGSASSQGANITYTWLNNTGAVIGTTSSITVSTAGLFFLAVTNEDNGCEDFDQVVVAASNDFPTATANANGELNCDVLIVTLTGNGSSTGGNFSYQWTNAAGNVLGTDLDISVSEAGTYTFEVTDNANGCVASSNVAVIENVEPPIVDIMSSGDFDCENPTVTLTAQTTPGTTNLAYSWTNSAGIEISTELAVIITEPGEYVLEITNLENGCFAATSMLVNGDTNVPTADAGEGMELSCQIEVITLGGNSSTGAPYIYNWQDGDGNIIGTDATINVNASGVYTLAVTNTDNGCVAEDVVVVTQNVNLPIANAGSDALLDCTTVSVILDGTGSSTGSNILYSWENSNGELMGTSLMIEVTSPDSYTLNIFDVENGCTNSDVVIVGVSTDFPTVVTNASGEINCEQGEITLSGIGSSTGAEFVYQWINASGNVIGSALEIAVQDPGTYMLMVENTTNGCAATEEVVVAANFDLPVPNVVFSGNLDCNTASITLDASTSQGNSLNYKWEDAAGNTIGTSSSLVVTSPGDISLIITDGDNGCIESWNGTITETEVSVSIANVVDVNCNGETTGSATAMPAGGVGSFDYLWSNGTVSATASGLGAGVYSVTVTDDNGCTSDMQVQIEQPTMLGLSVQSTNETGENLNDGSATASASGGTGNYSYQWSNNQSGPMISNLSPGAYMVTVTDENQCTAVEVFTINSVDCILQIGVSHEDIDCFGAANGSISLEVTAGEAASYSWTNAATTSSINGLAAGTYGYTVTDGNGCDITGQQVITEPTAVSGAIADIVNISCGGAQGGSATVIPGGGSEPYSYNWSSGESTLTATQLVAGINTVVISDANNCSLTLEVNITAEDSAPPIAITQDITVSLDGTGNVSISPAMINNGSTDNCGIASINVDQSNFDCTDVGTQQISLIVVDVSGNMATASAQVTVQDEQVPQLICPTGFSLTNCNVVNYDLPSVIDNCDNFELKLLAGFESGAAFPEGNTTVIYRVTDAAGNSAECSFEVSLTLDLDATLEAEDARCAGEASGMAEAFPSGGQPGYQYNWSNGQQTSTANGLAAGDHFVVITDDQGCTVDLPFSIDEPSALIFTLDDLQDDATGTGTGSISVSVAGGIPPYTYVWTLNGVFHSTDQDIDNLTAANYGLEIIDANGCELNQFGLIVENLVPTTESQYSAAIGVQPNPTRDMIFVDFDFTESKAVQVELFSVTGQLVLTKEIGLVGRKIIPMNLEALASGVYNLRLLVEDEVVVKRIVLQK